MTWWSLRRAILRRGSRSESSWERSTTTWRGPRLEVGRVFIYLVEPSRRLPGRTEEADRQPEGPAGLGRRGALGEAGTQVADGHDAGLATLARAAPGGGRGGHARGVREAQAARRAPGGRGHGRQEARGRSDRGPNHLPLRSATHVRLCGLSFPGWRVCAWSQEG